MSVNKVDIEQAAELVAYLKVRGCGEPASIQVLAGGVSNRTVLVQWPNGEAWVMKQALAKLRVKADWYSDPARIHREALGLQWMGTLLPEAAPALIFEDEAEHILAMQAVPQPHENWKVMLLRGDLHEDHVLQFANMLAGMQRHAPAHRHAIAAAFDDRTFFETLRLEPYFAYTATQVPQAASFLRALIERTLAHRHTLVHGDYSPKNVLVHQSRLVLLDYEVIHWGDPAFDVGFSMTHLLSKAHHLSTLRHAQGPRLAAAHRAAFKQAAHTYWQTYFAQVDGLFGDLEFRSVQCTLGCLLARVDGRSPLEYLGDDERSQQRNAVLSLMAHPPATMPALIDAFVARLET
jgi:5-methylthioribose kinase